MLIEYVLESARKYHDYLEYNNLGMERIGINRKQKMENGRFQLHLKQKLFNTENIHFMIRTVEYDRDKNDERIIELIEYDADKNLLTVKINDDNLPFDEVPEEEILIVSDLKFLIRNVEDYFERYAEEIEPPSRVPLYEVEVPDYLNEYQQNALSTVFNSPLSYIWGAPGTGKTRAVLFESIMQYVREGKRIALLAPTNNALEQILLAVLPKFEEIGLDKSKILRIGMPSNHFFETHPEVCETKVIEKQKKQQSLFDFDGEEQENAKDRVKKAKIIASTLDTFIMRDDINGIPFAHIFLDEAGFANLIKALALCKNGVPLTMLGDHRQLPPICEMDPRQIKDPANEEVCLWDMSALHLEALFYEEPHEVFLRYVNGHEPEFQKTAMSELLKTHRYGPNLCTILDQHVYRNGLYSGIEEPTGIYFIDVGYCRANQNSNGAEATACGNLAMHFLGEGFDDFGIITPFVNQRKAIQKQLPYQHRQDKVLTIHRSQGREFHTVIFSPVYLSRYFTDSSSSKAQKALNVAISRVQSRLILVCDVRWWSRQRHQMIGQLIECAQPFVVD